MKMESVISVKNLIKKYKGFKLEIENLEIPKRYATAIVGENGAGKSTLLDILAGMNLQFKGDVLKCMRKFLQFPRFVLL